MADRLAHPLHLVLAALVQDELERAPRRAGGTRAGAVGPSSSSTPSASRRSASSVGSPSTSRPRRPSRRRSADARAGARAGRRSSAAARRSCRRRAARPGRRATRGRRAATTVGRPCGSLAVVTTPGRLVQQHVAELLLRDPPRRPPRRRRATPTNVFSSPGSPFTRTRPALISSSAPAARGDAGAGEEGVQPHDGIRRGR